MKSFATLITACIVAVWIGAIALIAIQNATPVTLRFLTFQMIEIPFGLVIAFSIMIGIIGSAIAQPLLGFSSSQNDED
ncbi:MAG: DUF1049 domain-containing protein [Leptolyngbya sp. Prado105]|jgi:uncharacterized integral membrane protein|nr:DUF1049 domain-containing protein [Leptolyngbya sp. Prado105]